VELGGLGDGLTDAPHPVLLLVFLSLAPVKDRVVELTGEAKALA
jgi:hypothetical protein